MKDVAFRCNDREVSVSVREDESLLETLRERLATTSPKDGCAPQGQCGACLAIVSGRPVVTCAMKTAQVQGKEVHTLEGIRSEEQDRLAACFAEAAGVQCGYCIPGIALRAYSLVQRDPNPSRATIQKALDVHLCRCTGYTKILDAIERYAATRRGEHTPAPEFEDGAVGGRLARYQSKELTLGLRPYVADMQRPGMLYGAVRLSDHARALVRSIDITGAQAVPGVEFVATARDVAGTRRYGLIEQDWPGFVAEGEEVRCVGDVLAAVAAKDEATARRAAQLIHIEYEVREPVLTAEDALAPTAPQVNPAHPNQLSHTRIRRGDVSQAFARSAHVVEETFETQRIEHLYLEPECALVEPCTPSGFKLYTQGQGIFDDRRQVAAFLGIEEESLAVELVPNGGAFGGKEDMSIQAHTALLAFLTRKPVKLRLSREESVRLHPKRHPIKMRYKVGCDADGLLTAVEAEMLGDSGAYASVGAKVLERAAGHAAGPYRVRNVAIDAIATYTNNPPCGAMRGFGANQAHFAMESCVDMLAQAVGLDPWEMRFRNAVEETDTFTTGQVFEKSVGLKKTLLAVKDRYDEARAAGRAVGIACGLKNSGIGNGAVEFGKARLVVEEDRTVSLYNGYTEMGQGLLTVLVQCAAEVTGLPASVFRPQVDSRFALGCGQTTGSRATLFGGRAVVSAARKLKRELEAGKDLTALAGQVFAADFVCDDTTAPGDSDTHAKVKTHTAFGFATQVVILNEEGTLEHVIAAHDVGRAINPALCEGQIEGSVHMGLGYALSEELPCVNGMPVTFKMREIGVLRARDTPQIEVILVEEREPEGPFGAKGVGEIGLVPTAAAVAAALHAFDGVRRTRLPMKDSPAARALRVGRIRGFDPNTQVSS